MKPIKQGQALKFHTALMKIKQLYVVLEVIEEMTKI
jgi:hypothetical protein